MDHSEGFLPMTIEEAKKQGAYPLDFVYVIGDAYVDHPSFGHAVISRLLWSRGYKVGLISQPDWKNPESIAVLGTPRLGFLVTAGNMDSMVNHYTVSKKHRGEDLYTPGGASGKRPDRAAMVYCNLIRARFPGVPIIAGGIEASLRRLAHYDYWSEKLRRSVLMDCGADLVSYGMGEKSILEIARQLNEGKSVREMTDIPGTCYKTKDASQLEGALILPSYEEIRTDKKQFAKSFRLQYENTDPFTAKRLAENYGTVWIVQNPPSMPLTQEEMDEIYDLPYRRRWHPSYDSRGGVRALEEVLFSLVSCRGCFGGCHFCALTFHQGRIIQSRSHESIIREAQFMIKDPRFKGYIHDVGGPTANFRHPACRDQLKRGACKNRQCLWPEPCPKLNADHTDYLALLRKLRSLPGVKKVFIRSGIRFDYVLADHSDAFLRELIQFHVSGQLKVAPEHVSSRVLEMMGKPGNEVYTEFENKYRRLNAELGKKQYLVPYLMSSHPGCRLNDAVELAVFLHRTRHRPEQVQDFYPTPSTISTCMYYTGYDPLTMKRVYVPRSFREKAMQRALLQYTLPANRDLVAQALKSTGREDLIGYGGECLISPVPDKNSRQKKQRKDSRNMPRADRQTRGTGISGKTEKKSVPSKKKRKS